MTDARQGLYKRCKRDADHAEFVTKRLKEESKIPTERDYQHYVGDSFNAFNDTLKELEKRILDLEEKERDRERIEYQKEMALVSKDLDAIENGTYDFGE